MVWESQVSVLLGTPQCAAPCISGRCWLGSGTDLWGLPWRFGGSCQHRSLVLSPSSQRCSGAWMTSQLQRFLLLASFFQETDQRLSRTHCTGWMVAGSPQTVPETPVVGLMDGSGFMRWPAQLWLGRCGIRRLVCLCASFWLCGKGERVWLCAGALAQLCLSAPQQLKCRCWGAEPAGELHSCLSQLSRKVQGAP